MQVRRCEIVQDADKLKVDIESVCRAHSEIVRWVYILHDKDDGRPHYHIVLDFGHSSCDTLQVAEWFKLGYVNENGQEHSGEQFVCKIRMRSTNNILVAILKYLVHESHVSKLKHTYDRSELHANFNINAIMDS